MTIGDVLCQVNIPWNLDGLLFVHPIACSCSHNARNSFRLEHNTIMDELCIVSLPHACIQYFQQHP